MSLLAGLVLRDAGRPARSRGLDALLAAEPAGDPRLRADRPGMILAGAGEGAQLEESPSGWLLADVDVPGVGDLATPGALQALWSREGSAVLSRLRGGFAVALVDPARRHALLAADRFGFRRLYYAETAEGLAWGTRAEAALAAGGVSRAVDPEAVYAYLNYGTVPAPQTIYRGVRRLPPGHCLAWRDGTVSIERYWDVAYHEEPVSREVAAAALMRHTETAVGATLTGLEAKETGAFLSGGTDSSTVVGLITRLTGERANAFSIGFAEERYNELGYAEIAARHFNAAHHTKRVSADEAYACMADLVSAYDEPFGNASAIPTLLCARFARQTGMRTLLAGDGGDEIFGGNERYRREQVLARYDRLPAVLRRGVIEPILRRVPAERGDLLGKAQRYVERASAGNPARFYASEFFVARERAELLHPDFLAAITADGPLRVAERHYRAAHAGAELNRLLYIDVKITLGDNDLFKVTRTAEAAGMAVRFPLLDHPLVEFMATLPAWHKVRGTEKRHLFKRAMRGFLPAEILAKPKHGFGLPISDWLRDHAGFRELLRDTVASRAARERGYWAPGALESLCDRFARDTTAFYGGVLWTVLMLELWHARHGDRG